ncbi:MAG: quinolinate synthase NadA [Desulfobacteraceae bacterium]|nr:quinolinate synthase NadA [Desulfobacteraceae bacterium]MBU4000880.1 quinolinate synthase NadA [Pseudomonadota bacterium]
MKEKIRQLVKERNAVILAHNYQPPEIQDVADLCGDSLELSIQAAKTDAKVIVFCGVHFMAETASILSPEKTVLLPRENAGCPMADMVTPSALEARIKELGPMPVVTYVNSSAAVKALSTICCTSANAVKVVNSLKAEEILMIPDKNLARNTAKKTTTRIHLWEGYCPIHDRLTAEDVLRMKKAHPEAVFMAHPECRPEVIALADISLSTSGMIRHAMESDRKVFIVGTEVGMLYPLQKANPGKVFIPASQAMSCEDMKKITLEDILNSLEHLTGEVKVPEEIRIKALSSVERMIQLS